MRPPCVKQPRVILPLLPGESGGQVVAVTARPHPFRLARADIKVEAGASLAQIVGLAIPDRALQRWAAVSIEGHVVPREHWSRVRPKAGALVEVRAGLGDGGGEKSPLRTILMVAVIVAAAYISGGALAGTWLAGSTGLSFAAGSTSAALAGAFVSVAGGLLVNAIAPPSAPKSSETSSAGMTRSSPTYDIAGARNTARPFGTVKRVLGEHKVAADHGARPYTELVGDDEYLRMLLVWSIGPVDVTGRRIGETALEAFDGVETEFRRGYQASQLTDQGAWDAGSGSYPAAPDFGDWYTVSGAGTVDGMAWAVGDTLVFNGLAAATTSEAWDRDGNKPLSLFSNAVFQDDLAVQLTFAGGAQTRTTQVATDEISIDLTFPGGLVRIANDGDRHPRGCTFLVQYRAVGDMAWQPAPGLVDGRLTVTGRRTSAVRGGHRWAVPAGQYDVRLTRLSPDSASAQHVDASAWTALRSISSTYPVDTPVGLAVEAVRIKATGQLSGIVDQYQGVVTSICPDWDEGDEAWVMRPTRNNAALYRAVCQDAGQSRPRSDAALDLAGLQAWHGLCKARGYRFDAVIDFAISTRELLQDIASAGCARVARPGGLWGVVTDEPKPVVQVFTPRNSWGFSGSKAFVDLPHALRMRFVNREMDWADDERIVYRDGYGPSNATLYEGLEHFGVTDPAQIWRRGREHLASAQLRPERYSLNTDVAWLVANDGDAIRVQHDVMVVGLGSGRIKALVLDEEEDNVTGLVLDELLEMEEGKSYVLRIQHVRDDGTVETDLFPLETDPGLEPGGVTEVVLATPVPVGQAPDVGDLALFGLAGRESIEGVIVQIRPRADLSAQIVFVDAAPQIAEAAMASREILPEAVDAGADSIEVADNPFWNGDVVQFATGGALPPPLAAVTDYWIVGRDDEGIQLAATAGGAPIDLTGAGTGTHTVTRRIPDFDSGITAPVALGVPLATSVASDGTVLFREPDGSWTSRILVGLQRPSGLQTAITGVEARFRPAGSSEPWSSATAERAEGEISLLPVEDRAAYEYQLRWLRGAAGPGPWSALAEHTVVGKTAPPAGVAGFSAQQNGSLVTFRWSQIPDLDRDGYLLRYAPQGAFVWANATEITSVTRGTLVTNAAVPPGDWTVAIKAIDTSGNESAVAATFDLDVVNANDVIEVAVHAPRWVDRRLSSWSGFELDETEALVDAMTSAPADARTTLIEGTIVHYMTAGLAMEGIRAQLFGLRRHDVSGRLVPASTRADSTDDDVFDSFVPDPVPLSTYEGHEGDVGLDGTGVRAWATTSVPLGPGETAPPALTVLLDYRSGAGTWDGWEPWTVGRIDARHTRWRAELDNTLGGIAALAAFDGTVDVEERSERHVGVTVGIGGTTLAFDRSFFHTPAIEISAEAGPAAAVRHPVWADKTTAQVELYVYDGSNTDVGGIVDVTLRGV